MRRIIFSAAFTILGILQVMHTNAQDEGRAAAKKQVAHSSEQADKQLGKKIQQQSLAAPFEKPDSIATVPPQNKKPLKKSKRVFIKAGA